MRLLIKTCFDNQFFPYLTKSFFIQCATRSKIVTTHIIITSVSGLLFSLIVSSSSGKKRRKKVASGLSLASFPCLTKWVVVTAREVREERVGSGIFKRERSRRDLQNNNFCNFYLKYLQKQTPKCYLSMTCDFWANDKTKICVWVEINKTGLPPPKNCAAV